MYLELSKRVRFPPTGKKEEGCAHNGGLIFEYRPGLYYEKFLRNLRLPRPTLPLEYVFIHIRSTHCGGALESG